MTFLWSSFDGKDKFVSLKMKNDLLIIIVYDFSKVEYISVG